MSQSFSSDSVDSTATTVSGLVMRVSSDLEEGLAKARAKRPLHGIDDLFGKSSLPETHGLS
jgi:hypothetical protein